MEKKFQLALDGQELRTADINQIASEAAMADDRVLAQLLRMAPYDGTTFAKAVLPYGAGAIVQPNGATGSVKIMPFRAIVGSRATVAVGGADINYRDIRSTVFAKSTNGTTLGFNVNLTANPNLYNDLTYVVYAAVSIDAIIESSTILQKDPTSKVVASQTVTTNINTVIGIVVQEPSGYVIYGSGNHGIPPVALPADNAGVIYIPLAYVRIPGGFTSSSTVLTTDILEIAPVVSLHRATGSVSSGPPSAVSKNIDVTTTYLSSWVGLGNRPPTFLPSGMVGGEHLFFQHDPSTAGTFTIDDTRDWRYRMFPLVTLVAGSGSSKFAQEPSPGTAAVPSASYNSAGFGASFYMGIGQSFADDSSIFTGVNLALSNCGVIAWVNNGSLSQMAASSVLCVFVDMASGALKLSVSTTPPGRKFFISIFATAPYSNY